MLLLHEQKLGTLLTIGRELRTRELGIPFQVITWKTVLDGQNVHQHFVGK